MKQLGDFLLSPSGGAEIVMGNTAIVRAMIEAGVRVVTSYPGSPTPEIATAISSIPIEKRPFYFEFSVNEKVATEVAMGASVNGHLSCVFFKSVGLNVASDSFVQLGLLGTKGGMIIVLGDDPGANSSQNEQDNRHYAHMSYIPVLEPANAEEVYTMFKEAARLSVKYEMPFILRLTTHVCHGKEKVDFAPYTPKIFDNTSRFDTANGPYIPITSAVFPLKRKLLKKFEEIKEISEKYVKTDDNGNKKRGIITHGLPYLSLLDVLEEGENKPDILKMDIVYPIPGKRIIEFLKNHEEVKILEELDDLFEREIKALAYDNCLKTKIIGKKDIEDWMGEYTPDKVYNIIKNTWTDLLPEKIKKQGKEPAIPPRPAQMCPGCGHRSAFYAIKRALKENDITVGDIGCHSLGFLPPYNIGEILLSMGHSNGTAGGLTIFNKDRRVLSFLGDSTFYHAGLPGIINSIFNKHNHTLIIMENGTTAMTGHQDNPVSGKNFNEIVEKIPIKRVLEGLGVKSIREVGAYEQKKLTEAVKEALSEDGFNVIIARHPCMLKFSRELRRKGKKLMPPVKVNEKCNKSHFCVSAFACPSYQIEEDGTVWVQEDLCIGDGSCKQTCPLGAIEQSEGKGGKGNEKI